MDQEQILQTSSVQEESSTSLEIRVAELSEIGEVQRLAYMLGEKEQKDYYPDLNPNSIFEEFFTRILEDRIQSFNGIVLVARVKDLVVGYLMGSVSRTHIFNFSRIASLEEIFVIEDYRGGGIGTELCDRFKHWCKDKGASKIRVNVYAENREAIRFYQRQGFGKPKLLTLEGELE